MAVTNSERTRSQTPDAHSTAGIHSSSSESQYVVGQTPTQPRSAAKLSTTTRKPELSALCSPPHTPRQCEGGPSFTRTDGVAEKTTPRPKAKRKTKPTVIKLEAMPTRVIELSDTSDGEMKELARDPNWKGKGRAVDSEDEGNSPTSPTHPPPPFPPASTHESGWADFYASDEEPTEMQRAFLQASQLEPPSLKSHSLSAERPHSPTQPASVGPSSTSPPVSFQPSQHIPKSQGELTSVRPTQHRDEHWLSELDDSEHDLSTAWPKPSLLTFQDESTDPTPSDASGTKHPFDTKGKTRSNGTQASMPPSPNLAPPPRLSATVRSPRSPIDAFTIADAAPTNISARANADGTIDVDAWMYDIGAKAIPKDDDFEGAWVHQGTGAWKDDVGDEAVREDTGDGEWQHDRDHDEWRPGGRREEGSVEQEEEMAGAIVVAKAWDARRGVMEIASESAWEDYEGDGHGDEGASDGPRRNREVGNEMDGDVDPFVPGYQQLPRSAPQFREDDEVHHQPAYHSDITDVVFDGHDIPVDANAEQRSFDLEVEPAVPEDPVGIAFAAVFEMLPDIDPDHLLTLLETYMPIYGPSQIVQLLVAELFEESEYPRRERNRGRSNERVIERGSGSASGRRKVDQQGEDDAEVVGGSGGKKNARIEYASADRPNNGGVHYDTCAIDALQTAFPLIPLPYLRNKLASKNGLYVPTYLEIRDEEERLKRSGGVRRLYVQKTTAYVAKGKGKEMSDEVFEDEKRWLWAYLASLGDPTVGFSANDVLNFIPNAEGSREDENDVDEELEDDGTFVECGCCFSTYPFEHMTACPDAHLFCRSCLRQFAANELGSQNCVLKCMHTSDCTSLFPEHELRRLLPSKLFSLYSRLKQQKDLKEAGIDDLEECPFCDWACIVEISKDDDPVLRCENQEECGVVSCRLCRKQNHMPKTCREVGEDRHLDGRVAIEEAMTRALVRACPKCKKEFIKSEGCNKMMCPNCRTLSCYVCKKEIKDYTHFSRKDSRNRVSFSSKTKCPLYDSVDQRHEQEVNEAYQKALAEYKRVHPEVEVGKDLNIDLPQLPRIALERAIEDAEALAQRARDTLASAFAQQLRAHEVEDSLQVQLTEIEAGSSTGLVAGRKGVLFRLRARATEATKSGLARQISTARTARVSADRQFHVAEEGVEHAEERLADLRRQLEERR